MVGRRWGSTPVPRRQVGCPFWAPLSVRLGSCEYRPSGESPSRGRGNSRRVSHPLLPSGIAAGPCDAGRTSALPHLRHKQKLGQAGSNRPTLIGSVWIDDQLRRPTLAANFVGHVWRSTSAGSLAAEQILLSRTPRRSQRSVLPRMSYRK